MSQNPTASVKGRNRNRTTLLLIAAIFIAPIVVAWLFASGRLDLSQRPRSNHGQFIQPPIDVATLPQADAMKPLVSLAPAAWAVLYVAEGACTEGCEKALSELEVIRSLLGKEATRLSVFGVVGQSADPARNGPTLLADQAWVAAFREHMASRAPAGRALPLFVFLDWRGQIMMSFPPDAPPADIKQDLGRLLRGSAIR